MIGLDLVEFLQNGGVINWEAAQLPQRAGSLVVLVHFDEVPRGLREEDEPGKVSYMF
jgi:hypothetical protein